MDINDAIDIVNTRVRRWEHEDDLYYGLEIDITPLLSNPNDIETGIVFTFNPDYDYFHDDIEATLKLFKQCNGPKLLQFESTVVYEGKNNKNINNSDPVFSKTDFFDVNYYNEISDDYRNQYVDIDDYTKRMLIEQLDKIHGFLYEISKITPDSDNDDEARKLNKIFEHPTK